MIITERMCILDILQVSKLTFHWAVQAKNYKPHLDCENEQASASSV